MGVSSPWPPRASKGPGSEGSSADHRCGPAGSVTRSRRRCAAGSEGGSEWRLAVTRLAAASIADERSLVPDGPTRRPVPYQVVLDRRQTWAGVRQAVFACPLSDCWRPPRPAGSGTTVPRLGTSPIRGDVAGTQRPVGSPVLRRAGHAPTFVRRREQEETVMARHFKGKIAPDIRDSVPDWDPYLAPKA